MKLSIEEFIKFRNLIYDRTGIFYGENKIYYVKKRLRKRIAAGGFESVADYIRFLKFFDRQHGPNYLRIRWAVGRLLQLLLYWHF